MLMLIYKGRARCFLDAPATWHHFVPTKAPYPILIYEIESDIGVEVDAEIAMQVFNSSLRVSAIDAKQDRIRLRYSNWSILNNRPDSPAPSDTRTFNLFFVALAASPLPQVIQEAGPEYGLGEHHNVRVFRAVRDGSLPILYTHVRSQYARTTQRESEEETGLPPNAGGDRDRVPLFMGRLCLRGAGSTRRLVFDELQLNPTRYMAYQPVASGPVDTWPPPVLYANRRTMQANDEFSLSSGTGERYQDNLVAGEERLAVFRGRRWQQHVGRYWAAIRECLDYRILMAARSAGAVIDNATQLSLRQLETYWEFRAGHPIALVHDLLPRIGSLGMEYRDRRYPTGFQENSRDENSPSVKVRLRPGVFLRLYAKTNQRVRFEIIHDFTREWPQLSSENQIERAATNPLVLRRWLNACAQDAAVTLNEVLGFIERSEQAENTAPGLGQRPYRLLRLIAEAAVSETVAVALLDLLAENAVIEIRDASPLRRAIQRLQERGVLERTRRSARAVRLTPPYLPAMQMIREGRLR